MSERARRTKIVYDAAAALVAAGQGAFRPGDIAAHLRGGETPFGAWEVRGELSNLQRLGLIELDEGTATWRLARGAEFDIAAAKSVAAGGA